MTLKEGKLPADYLEKLLKILPSLKREIKTGPCIGGDSAVIKLKDFYIVVAQDPITFTEKDIGYYGVVVNANDVAVMGARPLYFLFTLLLPRKSDEKKIRKIFKDVSRTCKKFNITVIGGHTEITPDIQRVILSGTMIGIRKRNKGILPKKVKDGDLLFCIKEVPIEGVSIIAREKREIVEKFLGHEKAKKFSNYSKKPGISIVKEAVLISQFKGTLAMHDPTEGGIWNGIWEFAEFLNKGVIVYEEKIPIVDGFENVFKYFGINPMKTISSGALLVAIKKGYGTEFEKFCIKNQIKANFTGVFKDLNNGRYIIKNKRKLKLFSCQDEISKIF